MLEYILWEWKDQFFLFSIPFLFILFEDREIEIDGEAKVEKTTFWKFISFENQVNEHSDFRSYQNFNSSPVSYFLTQESSFVWDNNP